MERFLKHVQELGYFRNKTHTFKSINVVNLLWHVYPMMPLTEKVNFTTVIFLQKAENFQSWKRGNYIRKSFSGENALFNFKGIFNKMEGRSYAGGYLLSCLGH